MLGDKIRYYREALHISQEQLAERLGVPYQVIAMWEQNQVIPPPTQMNALAQLFGLSVDYLMSPSEQRAAPVAPQPTPVAQPVARPVAPQPASVAQPVVSPVAPQPTPVAQPVARPAAPQPVPVAQPVARPVAPQPASVAQPVASPVAPQPTPVALPVARPVAPQPTPIAQPVATPAPSRVIDELESEPTIVRPSLSKSAPFKPIEVMPDGTPVTKATISSMEAAKVKAEKEQAKKNSKFRTVIVICVLVIAILLGAILFFVMREPEETKEKKRDEKTTEVLAPEVLTAEDIYKLISPSVVEINASSSTMGSTGTGFFYDEEGTVVTNYHVIDGCTTAYITLSDGSTYDVISVLGYDEGRDIAVLQTKCRESVPLNIRSSEVITGESVYVLGSSLGLTGSLSDGIISAVDREVEGYKYLQTTAPISSGNSGGPLVDAKGHVIGIVCASFIDGQNLNLAIPINDLEDISMDEDVTLAQLFKETPAEVTEVEWLSDYRFEYFADEDTYVLLFQLSDRYGNPVVARGTVDIMVVNNDGQIVYEQTHRFNEYSFEQWYYGNTEMFLATIYVDPSEVSVGATNLGVCYFEVSGDNFLFETCSCNVTDLPTN